MFIKKSNVALSILLLLLFVAIPNLAQERDTDNGRDSQDETVPSLVIVDGNREVDSDCNDNGINDLDEFLPPDCYGQLTTEQSNTAAIYELDDWWLTVFDLQCPGGWTFDGNTGELVDCKQE